MYGFSKKLNVGVFSDVVLNEIFETLHNNLHVHADFKGSLFILNLD